MAQKTNLISVFRAIAADVKALVAGLSGKVDKVEGKGLSDENYTLAEKDKLGAIASGATANATDAQLRDRETHTGTQPISTVSGLQSALDNKAPSVHSHTAGQVSGLAAVATSGAYGDLSGKPTIPTIPGVATPSADGLMAAADKAKLNGIAAGATLNASDAQLRDRATHTGTQGMSTVAGLVGALDAKVDKVTGYGLSQTNFTQAEKDKLAALESSRWQGQFVSLSALQAGVPSPQPGDYADVDAGPGQDIERYIWDASDSAWVKQSGVVAPLTASQVKSLYEANPDTNAFSNAEKSKLSGVATGATANTGTVTSVGLSVPTGFSVANAPITGSGTITVTFAAGYSLPTTAKQGQWDTAYGWGNHASAGYATQSALTSGLAGKVDTNDSRLTNAREWTADTVGQAEAEAGAATTRRAWTAQRVRQAIVAWWNASSAKSKLDGIATGATANSSDAALLSRANHTGTQAIGTVSGLQDALDGKMPRRGLYVNQGNVPGPRYYLIGYIPANNGSIQVKGTIGGHEITTQGGASIDLTVNSRAGNIPIYGQVNGNLGLQDFRVYKDASNNVYVYVVTGHYALVDLLYSETPSASVYFSPAYTEDAPAHTLIFSAAAIEPGLGNVRVVGKEYLQPSTSALASLNIAQGATVSAPADGDIWMKADGLYFRAGGITRHVPLAALGTAASKDAQTSVTDSTAGRLLTVGAFGWGSSGLPVLGDMNDVSIKPGLYQYSSSSGSLNGPDHPGGFGIVLIVSVPGNAIGFTNWAQQLYFNCYPGGRIFMRTATAANGAAWSAWSRVPFTTEALATFAGNLPAARVSGLATVATSGSYNDLSNKPSIPAAQINADWNASSGLAQILNKPGNATTSVAGLMTAADKLKLDGVASGATANATNAQLRDRSTHTGSQAISTVSGLQTALDNKVDKLAGYGLSQNNFTSAEKSKLASLESSRWKGQFVSLVALQSGVPSPQPGDYADVDEGAGHDIVRFVWDNTDSAWVKQSGDVAPLTAAQIKTLYESNADTNAYTNAEKSKLTGIATGATANTGTVTSVQVSVPTGLSVAGGPITTSGTLAISYQTGYSIPANSKQNQWDVAYGWGNHASAGYAKTSDLAAVAASGSYADLSSKPGNATTSVAGFMSGADKAKLDGVASGATANATNAQLRDRSTHTGTQAISTIASLQEALQAANADYAGATEPEVTWPWMKWADTGNMLLKRRNAANTAWVVEGTLLTTVAFRYSAIGGQVWSSSVWTRVNVGSQGFDTDSIVSGSVATPKVAGYYLFSGLAQEVTATASRLSAAIYKNGVNVAFGTDVKVSIGGDFVFSSSVSTLLYMNGSTDYVELYVYAEGAGLSAGQNTRFEGTLLRAA